MKSFAIPYVRHRLKSNGLIANISKCESRLLTQAYISHIMYTLANKGDEKNLQK